MKIRLVPIVLNLVLAVIFGALFWYFLERVQADFVQWKSACCERCANIVYDIGQPIIAFCGGLSFFVSSFFAVRGWKIIFKAIATSWLCFQIYWFMTFWAAIHYRECTAINYPKGLFPILGGISMQIETIVWAVSTAIIFLLYNVIRWVFLPDEVGVAEGDGS